MYQVNLKSKKKDHDQRYISSINLIYKNLISFNKLNYLSKDCSVLLKKKKKFNHNFEITF